MNEIIILEDEQDRVEAMLNVLQSSYPRILRLSLDLEKIQPIRLSTSQRLY